MTNYKAIVIGFITAIVTVYIFSFRHEKELAIAKEHEQDTIRTIEAYNARYKAKCILEKEYLLDKVEKLQFELSQCKPQK